MPIIFSEYFRKTCEIKNYSLQQNSFQIDEIDEDCTSFDEDAFKIENLAKKNFTESIQTFKVELKFLLQKRLRELWNAYKLIKVLIVAPNESYFGLIVRHQILKANNPIKDSYDTNGIVQMSLKDFNALCNNKSKEQVR